MSHEAVDDGVTDAAPTELIAAAVVEANLPVTCGNGGGNNFN